MGDPPCSVPSAELALNQEDERDLMPFPVLDAFIALAAGEKLMPREIHDVIRMMWTDDEFRAMDPSYQPGTLKQWMQKGAMSFMRSIFKWVQAPEAVHQGAIDLDRERALQIPVVQSLEWLRLGELEIDA